MPTTSERVELVTPLGEDLLFHGMQVQEELSRLGDFQLDLLSKKYDIDRDQILGGKVAIKVLLSNDEVRHFNGFVTRFSAGAALGKYARYHAVVTPWLWFLTRTADCRIFQDKTVRQIVEEVFADHAAVADFAFELNESYDPLKYCVQYRETDFNFVSRLLEHEGIYYYFRHTDGHHTMVLTDSVDKHEPTPGYEKLQYIPPSGLVRPGTEHVSAWSVSREVQPGAYVHEDYDFERPSVDLTTSKTLPRGYTPSDYEVYDYPGCYVKKALGERHAHVRIDEYGARFEKAHGTTNYRGVKAGAKITLEGHSVDKFNGDYVVVGATHVLETSEYESGDAGGSDAGFHCHFTALSCAQQYRPPRVTPKPFVQGPQTAIVVGPAGDEIYTDKYGRVKVQFHWDRKGKKDENSSCWIRVSHPWAGKGWGAVATPRIGQEVIVDFLEGDPDQPIITGRVYNEENQPPFGFPAGAVISGVKSDTHKGGGFNEMSLDDTAGKERVFIHGQYNMDTVVEHDQTSTIHNNRTDVIDVDDSETVSGNQTQHVVKDQTIDIDANRTETVGKEEKITIHGNRTETVHKDETVTIQGSMNLSVARSKSETVTINSAETVGVAKELSVGGLYQVSVGGAHNTTVGAAHGLEVAGASGEAIGGGKTIAIGSDHSLTIGGSDNVTVTKDRGLTVNGQYEATVKKEYTVKAKTITLQAEDEILISVGKAKIAMKKDGTVTVEGKDVSLKASGKINQKADGDVIIKGSKVAQN